MRVNRAAFVVLAVGGALAATGAAPGCASPPPPLGKDCGQACTALCVTSGPDVDDICGTSVAPAQCAGSGDQYCTKACAADTDCQPAPFAMRCLTACAQQPQFVGLCWSAADWTSLVDGLCR